MQKATTILTLQATEHGFRVILNNGGVFFAEWIGHQHGPASTAHEVLKRVRARQ